jgi:hypothetical protein
VTGNEPGSLGTDHDTIADASPATADTSRGADGGSVGSGVGGVGGVTLVGVPCTMFDAALTPRPTPPTLFTARTRTLYVVPLTRGVDVPDVVVIVAVELAPLLSKLQVTPESVL